jgi:hypothetical protein
MECVLYLPIPGCQDVFISYVILLSDFIDHNCRLIVRGNDLVVCGRSKNKLIKLKHYVDRGGYLKCQPISAH